MAFDPPKTRSSRVYKELQSPYWLKPGVTFTSNELARKLGPPYLLGSQIAGTIDRLVKLGDVVVVDNTHSPHTSRLARPPVVIEKNAPAATGPRKTKKFLARQAELEALAATKAAKKAANSAWPSPAPAEAPAPDPVDVAVQPKPKPEPTSTDKWFRERWPSAGGLLDVGTLFRQLQYHIDHGIKAIDADAIPDEMIKAQFVKRFL